jgi:hypothetical protein
MIAEISACEGSLFGEREGLEWARIRWWRLAVPPVGCGDGGGAAGVDLWP